MSCDHPHLSALTAYQRGCRCDRCRTAKREGRARWNVNRKPNRKVPCPRCGTPKVVSAAQCRTCHEATRPRREPLDRFLDMIDFTESCWLWTGPGDGLGYGSFGLKTDDGWRVVKAHRFAYETMVGPIPAGLHIDHLCRVRHCVNPDHLEPVTLRENILRGVSPAARNALKTHCPKSHEYIGNNLYIFPDGSRGCRACAREWQRNFNARRRKENVA